jgi:hypothetical protein
VSHQVGRKARLNEALHSKLYFKKENVWKASIGVAALPGASACKLWQERREQRCWESVTGRASYTPHQALHCQKSKAENYFQGSLERQDEAFEAL